MFTDPKERKIENKRRREEKVLSLMMAMQDPEEYLFSIKGLFELERRGSYICAFVEVDIDEDRDYDQIPMYGDIYTEMYKAGLFNAERDCVRNRNNFSIESAIPVLRFSEKSVLECIVIDTAVLLPEQQELIKKNYEVAQTALSNQD